MDIGANIGMHTFRASKFVGKIGKVYAFEPELFNYKCLSQRSNKFHIKNIIAERLALSDHNESTKIYLALQPTCHSFSKKNLDQNKIIFQTVKTIRLDDYMKFNNINHVDIIQIDVQGAEAKVFRGAKNLIRNGTAKIIMEYWPQGILNMGDDPFKLVEDLENYGYKFEVIDKGKNKITQISFKKLIDEAKNWIGTIKYTNLLLTKS